MITCADCVDYMRDSMADDSIDLTVTSPPYDDLRDYDGYKFDFENIAKQLYRVTKPGGVVVWVVNDQIKDGNRSLNSFRQGLYFQQIGFKVHDVMIWHKTNPPRPRSNAYKPSYEFMFIFAKGVPNVFNRIRIDVKDPNNQRIRKSYRNKQGEIIHKQYYTVNRKTDMHNVVDYATGWQISSNDKFAFEHPAIMPERLAADHIKSWSNPGDLVFDPMCGSGTVPKMAMALGRKWIGVDISEKYCEIARRRTAAPMEEFL